ncbi:MAG: class I SAM-dependent methyltransferase [Thermoanaerobaculia bacterium]
MALVGPLEESFYDNPTGDLVFPGIPPAAYDVVFDFGCGCGRVARKLIQQHPAPGRYLGIDLHSGMVDWCRRNLSRVASNFEFRHHDVWNRGFNPEGMVGMLPFPVEDSSVTLFVAWSVFTHVNEAAAAFYLRELGRVLHEDGIAITTWFLFEKSEFPMMQEFQNALFINDTDPTNAVIFDKAWLRRTAENAGLSLSSIVAPTLRGFQWQIQMKKWQPGTVHAEFPADVAPLGLKRPPLSPVDAHRLGRD